MASTTSTIPVKDICYFLSNPWHHSRPYYNINIHLPPSLSPKLIYPPNLKLLSPSPLQPPKDRSQLSSSSNRNTCKTRSIQSISMSWRIIQSHRPWQASKVHACCYFQHPDGFPWLYERCWLSNPSPLGFEPHRSFTVEGEELFLSITVSSYKSRSHGCGE